MDELATAFTIARVDKRIIFSALLAETYFACAFHLSFDLVDAFIELKMGCFFQSGEAFLIFNFDNQKLDSSQSEDISRFFDFYKFST